MPTIVEQLQTEALATNIPVSTLLRKVKLVATKLGLPHVNDWVESELNGYECKWGELPEYRKLNGNAVCYNPVRGWIPMHGPAAFIERVARAYIYQSAPTLDALLAGKGQRLYLQMPEHIAEPIVAQMNYPFPRIGQELHRSQIVGLLERVRTMVLDWALELERRGIVGSEIGFDETEKDRARDKQINIHIGTIANFSASASGDNARVSIGSTDLSSNRK